MGAGLGTLSSDPSERISLPLLWSLQKSLGTLRFVYLAFLEQVQITQIVYVSVRIKAISSSHWNWNATG